MKYELRQFGEATVVAVGDGRVQPVGEIAKWLPKSALPELIRRASERNLNLSVSIHFVSPGGHADPLSQRWVVGWKVIARFPQDFDDSYLPVLTEGESLVPA